MLYNTFGRERERESTNLECTSIDLRSFAFSSAATIHHTELSTALGSFTQSIRRWQRDEGAKERGVDAADRWTNSSLAVAPLHRGTCVCLHCFALSLSLFTWECILLGSYSAPVSLSLPLMSIESIALLSLPLVNRQFGTPFQAVLLLGVNCEHGTQCCASERERAPMAKWAPLRLNLPAHLTTASTEVLYEMALEFPSLSACRTACLIDWTR